MDVILIECAHQECGFTVGLLTLTAGETYFLEKKIESRSEAFRVVSCKGQLGQEKSIIATKIDTHNLLGDQFSSISDINRLINIDYID